ncbi:UNVERIFIED_CONTAM: hypothetical protein Scaly_2775500 [Sesamum calycinum]|uniref:Uncharacterized protein n=1 Tax=Sesamum calycinum TaxID=2727403 RepID=A0AAW2IZ13_9LAMI
MACYVEEEEVWKCPTHPTKRRRNGICPICLRDRLVSLCPDCAHVRPCGCVASAESSSSSSSSSFGRVSNLIDGEPSFRRSRSLAIPFLRTRNSTERTPNNGRTKTPSFLSVLKRGKTKPNEAKGEEMNKETAVNAGSNDENFDSPLQNFKRGSISTGTSAMASGSVVNSAFESPMKAFRSSKTPKIPVQDRSPLPRG